MKIHCGENISIELDKKLTHCNINGLESKESTKVDSTVLTGQRETTCNDEKERADIDLEFPFWFSVVVLTRLSAGLCLV